MGMTILDSTGETHNLTCLATLRRFSSANYEREGFLSGDCELEFFSDRRIRYTKHRKCAVEVLRDAFDCGYGLTPLGDDIWTQESIDYFADTGYLKINPNTVKNNTIHFQINWLRPWYESGEYFYNSVRSMIDYHGIRPVIAFYIAHFLCVTNSGIEENPTIKDSILGDQSFITGGCLESNSSFLNHLAFPDNWELFEKPLHEDYSFMQSWIKENGSDLDNTLDNTETLEDIVNKLTPILQRNISMYREVNDVPTRS